MMLKKHGRHGAGPNFPRETLKILSKTIGAMLKFFSTNGHCVTDVEIFGTNGHCLTLYQNCSN